MFRLTLPAATSFRRSLGLRALSSTPQPQTRGRPARPRARAVCATRAFACGAILLGLAGCGPHVQPEELGEILVDNREIPGATDYVPIPELAPPGGRRTPEEMMRRMGMPPPEGMSFEEMRQMMEARAKEMEERRSRAKDDASQGQHAADEHPAGGEHDHGTSQGPAPEEDSGSAGQDSTSTEAPNGQNHSGNASATGKANSEESAGPAQPDSP